MTAQQLDLLSEGASSAEHRSPRAMTRHEALVPARLDDATLIEAIPDAGIANAPELAAEAGRRRLAAAIPALNVFAGGLSALAPITPFRNSSQRRKRLP